ncbi:hypothetical protein ACHHYP_00168 [Achlya hypogyna]|uniref:Uncharacterized protein n=1 Tax=Achlya hypogyna TaxID=1202772 RepID=A0A1V9ZBC8_ACHHY|nr:hypothetical protein ACHHYP_00168 [Achlya hypogyna]
MDDERSSGVDDGNDGDIDDDSDFVESNDDDGSDDDCNVDVERDIAENVDEIGGNTVAEIEARLARYRERGDEGDAFDPAWAAEYLEKAHAWKAAYGSNIDSNVRGIGQFTASCGPVLPVRWHHVVSLCFLGIAISVQIFLIFGGADLTDLARVP